ncbi:hypothetical protein BGX28_004647 [Mortierella sp. GBA30]|nr:hypothetical protein BGX28_004647 [Mortierella sp. GBA30]
MSEPQLTPGIHYQIDSQNAQTGQQPINTDEQYMLDLSESLRSCVGKSGPTSEAGDLIEGGILTSANHKSWYPHVHPTTWVHKVFSTHHYGNYVVSDRKTSATVWEDMPVYARIGMHLLFACSFDHRVLETHRLQHLFSEESLKQGQHFDAPESVAQIPHFIKTYRLDVSELLEPSIQNYGSFNEFFYRKLRPDARSVDQSPDAITSAADCRLSCFESVSLATQIWIKGQQFTLPRLLQDDALAAQYDEGSIAVFRLAPQDYHRFHSPVQGKIARDPVKIGGTYFTVNPMAVNENLNVFTENVRVVTVMDLDQDDRTQKNDAFDQCVFVAVGALLVGSIRLTGGEVPGTMLRRGDELGYFAYGGSTCILLFKKGAVKFDEDLINSSKKGLETLVRMGEHIGVRQ